MTPIQNWFKQTEIWLIPEDWEVVELGKIATFNQWFQVWLEYQFLEKKEWMKRFIRIVDFTKSWEEPIRFIENKNWNFHVKEEDLIMIRYWSQTAWKVIRWFDWIIANNMFKLNFSQWNLDYLYYYLSSESVYNDLVWWQNSSTMPAISFWYVWKLKLPLPPLSEQKAIAEILSSLDDKIELLEKQNKTLENIGQALFKSWFVDFEPFQNDLVESEMGMIPRGWKVESLDENITFLNWTALQNFKPKNDWTDFNVIKIRELSAWISNNTDKCNNKIDEKYIINNWDILFSWSWTLMVVLWKFWIWALNQHLFKVSSEKYSKWFIYYWLLHYLDFFKHIAASKATTMWHIQRTHLTNSKILVPDDKKFKIINELFEANIEKIENNNLQIQTLSNLRDTLLPRLMSGKIRYL